MYIKCLSCNQIKESDKQDLGYCVECQTRRDEERKEDLRQEMEPEPRELSDYEEHNTNWGL